MIDTARNKNQLLLAAIGFAMALVGTLALVAWRTSIASNQLFLADQFSQAGIEISGSYIAGGEFTRLCFEPLAFDRDILRPLKNDWKFSSLYYGERARDIYHIIFLAADEKTKYFIVRDLEIQAPKLKEIFVSTECIELRRVSLRLRSMRSKTSSPTVEEIDVIINIDQR